jgi:hypothetical protein
MGSALSDHREHRVHGAFKRVFLCVLSALCGEGLREAHTMIHSQIAKGRRNPYNPDENAVM